jgi:hypothetical protein
MLMNPFTPEIVSWATAAQAVYQIPASLNLSAAKLESNLGRSTPPGTNNWHGIKDPHNTSTTSTKEQQADGSWYTIAAGFKVFASPADSFMYYGRLLGLAAPYHDMVTKFLASPRGPTDVAALSHALTGVYATAHAYGDSLVAIQQEYNLYQFDTPAAAAPPIPKGPTVTDTAPTPAPAPVSAPVVVAPVIVAPTPPAPSVKQTALDVGDALEVLLKLAEAAADAGLGTAMALLPAPLKMVATIFGPTVIQGYIHSAFLQLETAAQGKTLTIDTSNALIAMVVQNLNDNENLLVGQLGSLEAWVEPMVTKFLASLGAAKN